MLASCSVFYIAILASTFTFSQASLVTRDASQLCDAPEGSKYPGTYKDGSGSYVSTDRITHPYKFPLVRKCWFDYYIVDSSLFMNNEWRKATGDIYCSGTSHCTVSSLNGTEYCQTRTESVGLSIGLESPQVGGTEPGKIKFGVDYSSSLSQEGCYSSSNTKACEWDDKGCHTVYIQQQLLKQKGYRRQRCDWGNGDETWCMADIEITTPTTFTNYQCGALCGKIDMELASTTSSTMATTSTISISTYTVTVAPAAVTAGSIVSSVPASSSSMKSGSSCITDGFGMVTYMGIIVGLIFSVALSF